MLEKDPNDIYRDYQRFMRKKDFRRAYQALETLLREFPGDIDFLQEGVMVAFSHLQRPDKAKHWLKRIIEKRDGWYDYLLMARIEHDLNDIPRAFASLKRARELLAKDRLGANKRKEALAECSQVEYKLKLADVPDSAAREVPLSGPGSVRLAGLGKKQEEASPVKAPETLPVAAPSNAGVISSPHALAIDVKFLPEPAGALAAFSDLPLISLVEARLRLDVERLILQGEFNELLCLESLTGVNKYWYQVETAKKVLKYFHGRAILADEVGLGKTVEAAMILKEYLLRGMARRVLILVPPSLVGQWQEEMLVKFGLSFTTTEDPLFARDAAAFWKTPLLIVSINIAKAERNLPFISGEFYDMVVVDEAHHLRNRATRAWGLVNVIQKKFILLLTATPVQNNLVELYNLITLLKPGQFKTEKSFRKEFMARGDDRAPVNKDRLREMLKEVMIRNTRSAIDLKLPRRFAVTLRLAPTAMEAMAYVKLNESLRARPFKKPMINLLLREAGSSPFALRETLLKMIPDDKGVAEILAGINPGADIAKGHALLEILKKDPGQKKIIFTQYIKSLEYITNLLTRHGIPCEVFYGGMTAFEKDRAIARFKDEASVIVSTESGGEGRNLQFCNMIINFDLPWNPMKIEQRIGRLHRIGQTRDVFVFNLSVKGTIEDYIIEILDSKINMFEMVIGEIEPILGSVTSMAGGAEDGDFEDLIMDIWLQSKNGDELGAKMRELGEKLAMAREEYLKAKILDQNIFGDDYET